MDRESRIFWSMMAVCLLAVYNILAAAIMSAKDGPPVPERGAMAG